jgi:hypothetical protein
LSSFYLLASCTSIWKEPFYPEQAVSADIVTCHSGSSKPGIFLPSFLPSLSLSWYWDLNSQGFVLAKQVPVLFDLVVFGDGVS